MSIVILFKKWMLWAEEIRNELTGKATGQKKVVWCDCGLNLSPGFWQVTPE